MVGSVFIDQEDLIRSIIDLHCPNGIELDATYSRGNFYKNGIDRPAFCFDISPQFPFVTQACCTSLPLADRSVACTMFDPPFLATTGPSLAIKGTNNLIAQRFTVFSSEHELHEFYIKSLAEFYRVTQKNGVLIFKCQDKVSSGKQYFSHCFIYEEAKKLGWYPKDLFVLHRKNRMTPKWQQQNQQHARKFHSYFWVFEKRRRRVSYTGKKS